jgi:hypothetical protein
LSYPRRINFREAIENENLPEVKKLFWKNVHGIVVMKIDWNGKPFPMTKICSSKLKNTKKKEIPNLLRKGNNQIRHE